MNDDNNLEYLSEYIDLNNKKEVNKKEMVNNIMVYKLIYKQNKFKNEIENDNFLEDNISPEDPIIEKRVANVYIHLLQNNVVKEIEEYIFDNITYDLSKELCK